MIVACPKCHMSMKTYPRTAITKAVKRCVYCGHSFKIHSHIDRSSHIVTTRV